MFLCRQQLQLLASIREVGGRALTQRRWFPLVTHLRPLQGFQGNYYLSGKLSIRVKKCLNIMELNIFYGG